MAFDKSLILVGILWLAVIGSSIWTLVNSVPPSLVPAISTAAAVAMIIVPAMFFPAVSFIAHHSLFYNAQLAKFLNARFGINAFESFLVKLRPALLFATGLLIQGIGGLTRAYQIDAPPGIFVVAAFLLSGGIGFVLAHVVMYRRKLVGVYPTWELKVGTYPPAQPVVPAKSFREALPLYWKYLIGIFLFPSFAIIATEMFRLPREYIFLPFFAAAISAAWPVMTRKAKYSFWIFACGIYMLGALFGVLISGIVGVFIK
jgi:hypothetical protein